MGKQVAELGVVILKTNPMVVRTIGGNTIHCPQIEIKEGERVWIFFDKDEPYAERLDLEDVESASLP